MGYATAAPEGTLGAIVVCSGGVVQGVLASEGVKAVVIDWDDIEETSPEERQRRAREMLEDLAKVPGPLLEELDRCGDLDGLFEAAGVERTWCRFCGDTIMGGGRLVGGARPGENPHSCEGCFDERLA